MRPDIDQHVITQSDAQLIRSCLDGDPQQYQFLVQRHQSSIFAYLRGRLGSHADEAREEIAQEAFVRAYRKLKSLRKPESFLPWLIGIADRVCRETHRAETRRRLFFQRTQFDFESSDITGETDGQLDVRHAVSNLPEPYRHIILLRFFQNLTCAEIAEHLRIPLGTVTKTLSRAYQMLRSALSPRASSPRCAAKAVQS